MNAFEIAIALYAVTGLLFTVIAWVGSNQPDGYRMDAGHYWIGFLLWPVVLLDFWCRQRIEDDHD